MISPLHQLSLAAAVAVLALSGTACSKPASANADLNRDLETAGSSNGLQLAPSAGKTSVISAFERTPNAPPSPAPSKASQASRPNPPAPPQAAPEPTPAPSDIQAATPNPDSALATPPAPLPRPTPSRRQKEPAGGWRSPGDVIRDAPFPINP